MMTFGNLIKEELDEFLRPIIKQMLNDLIETKDEEGCHWLFVALSQIEEEIAP